MDSGGGLKLVSINPGDSRLRAHLEERVGHKAPFTVEELETIERVVVSYVSDASELAACCNTRSLILMGSEIGALEWVPDEDPFPELRRIGFNYSTLTDISRFAAHPRLHDVSLGDTLLQDASPLLTMPRRRYITLIGCPLSEESYFEVIPRLEREVPKRYAEDYTADELISYSPEPEWRLTRLIQSRGIRAVYSQGKALAPGLAYSDIPDLHSYRVTHDEVKQVLDQVDDGDLHGFMDRCKQIAFSK